MARTPRTRATGSKGEQHTHLEDLWDEPAVLAPPARPDAEVLQGVWTSVEGKRQARFLISGNRFTFIFADGEVYMGTISLDNGGTRTMDMQVEEGPAHHKGLVALCIYELSEDRLHWCTASPGQADRPIAFAEHHSRHLFLVFQREHPNGKQ
jgi:uncharacterized protein (TIGR03067 family)